MRTSACHMDEINWASRGSDVEWRSALMHFCLCFALGKKKEKSEARWSAGCKSKAWNKEPWMQESNTMSAPQPHPTGCQGSGRLLTKTAPAKDTQQAQSCPKQLESRFLADPPNELKRVNAKQTKHLEHCKSCARKERNETRIFVKKEDSCRKSKAAQQVSLRISGGQRNVDRTLSGVGA